MQRLFLLLGLLLSITTFSGSARDEDPTKPGLTKNAKLYENSYLQASADAQIIKLNNVYLFTTANKLEEGSFYGRYDSQAPTNWNKTTLVFSIPFRGNKGWNFNVGVAGFMLRSSTDVLPMFHEKNGKYNNPNYPFRWQIGYMNTTRPLLYNKVVWVPVQFPNYLANTEAHDNPQGTQIQVNQKAMVEHILANPNTPITFRWLVVYFANHVSSESSLITSQRGDQSTGLTAHGYTVSELHVTFSEPIELFNYFNGIQYAAVTPSGFLVGAMEGCEKSKDGNKISCPVFKQAKSVPGYTLVLEENDQSLYFELNDQRIANNLVDLSTINDSTDLRLIIEPSAIIKKLGANKEVKVSNWPQMSIYPTNTIQFKTKFSLFDTLQFELVVNQLSIAGRNAANQCAANTVCGQGTVGQDSEIRLPFVIRQQGNSKATSVLLQVKGEKIKFQDEWRCAFSNVTNQKVAIPLMLVFRHPPSTQHYSINDGCSGERYNISNNNQQTNDISRGLWFETVKDGQYFAELWLDMVFRLSGSSIQQDSQGGHWEGTMTAKGEIEVQAIWNL